MSLSLKAHPVSFLREEFKAMGITRSVDLLTAGFPCQDLSQAGQTKGIGGARSGLVREVSRLLAQASINVEELSKEEQTPPFLEDKA